jgi:hypothetical protein
MGQKRPKLPWLPAAKSATEQGVKSRPGADPKPVPKVSFVTRVGDLGCGVGYYK